MARKLLHQLLTALSVGAIMFFSSSCEGPAGPAGEDANETCKQCHNPEVVDLTITQYELSKHSRGEAAFEETGNATCAPCHETSGFKFVCAKSTPATFTLNTTTNKYVNNYVGNDTAAFGEFKCSTCHKNIHKAYDTTDFYPLTTIAAVPMTMWAGTKTIDLKQDGGKGNLCVKCHQPRPLTTSSSLSDGNVVDYASLVANPTAVYYDSAVGNKAPNKLVPGYRTHVHYGGVGAIYAGIGGIEFSGSLSYSSSKHTTIASCEDCHMADISGGAGGHTFMAKGNFKGCNVSGCHSDSPLSSTSVKVSDTKKAIQTLLETMASKLKSGGVEILHKDATISNLWLGLTKNNYDGYLDIYDPSTNPTGVFQNPAASSSWTTDQKNTNKALPKFTSLTNVQLGALINFQLCLREYSLGMHNTNYSKALLTNTIDALTAAGY
jgi:hypothetical protein